MPGEMQAVRWRVFQGTRNRQLLIYVSLFVYRRMNDAAHRGVDGPSSLAPVFLTALYLAGGYAVACVIMESQRKKGE